MGGGNGPKAKRGKQSPAPQVPRAQKGQRGAPAQAPRARPVAETHSGYPTVSLWFADRSYDGDWSWPTGDEARALLDVLFELTHTSWSELATQQTGPAHKRRPKHHSEQIADLCKEAQDRIVELHLDETFGDELFRVRFGGTGRLWGYKLDGTFYVLWWDRDHKVRPLD